MVASCITDLLAVTVLTAKLMTDLLAGTSTMDFLTVNGVTAMSVIDSLTGMVTMATSVAAMMLNDDVNEVAAGGNVAMTTHMMDSQIRVTAIFYFSRQCALPANFKHSFRLHFSRENKKRFLLQKEDD